MTASFGEALVTLDSLLLDPNNYRFQDDRDFRVAASNRIHEESVQKKTLDKLRKEGLSELKASIQENGFLTFERIVVRPYEADDSRFLVVEGNRRVAALKSLVEDDSAGIDVRRDVLHATKSLPVLVVDSSQDPSVYLAMMGLRHVGGIKQWGPYQSSKLVSEMRETHELEFADISARLGMTVRDVMRRYRAYCVLRQYEDDEEFGEFANRRQYPMFHEAVSQPTIREWMGWSEDDFRFSNDKNRGLFYRWISPGLGDEGELSDPKISRSSEVRDLKKILESPDATSILYDSTKSFSQALAAVEQEELRGAWKAEVAEASAALRAVSILELKDMGTDEAASLRGLSQLIQELLDARTKLQ